MKNKFFLGLCFIASLFLLATNSYALTLEQETALGRAAGEYYGAVAMNQEFKKSICGEHLKITTTWYDTEYAMNDIKKTVPNSVKDKAQVLKTLPQQAEALRLDVRSSVVGANDQKCRLLAKRIYSLTTPLIIKWMDMK